MPVNFKSLNILLINIAIIGTIAMLFIPNQQTEALATVDHTIIEQLKVESTKQNQIQQIKQQAIIKQLSLKKQQKMKRLAEKTKEETLKTVQPIKVRTDGFSFNGYHYDIRWFSGEEYVTANQYIYRWTKLANHYLIEKYGQARNTIWTIQVGTQIIINGHTYTCYKILNHINRLNGYDVLINEHAVISAQTCETDGGDWLTLWVFK